MCHAIGVLLRSLTKLRLCQRAMDKTIFRVHDSRLRVLLDLLLHTFRRHHLRLDNLISIRQLFNITLHRGVVLQQLNGKITRGIQGAYLFVLLQMLLDMHDTRLQLMTMRDMDMTCQRTIVLIDADDLMEQFLDSPARLERGGNKGNTEQGAQCLDMYEVTSALKLVIHIQGTYHTHIHIHQLRRQVKVALEIRRVNHIDDHIGMLLHQVFTDI